MRPLIKWIFHKITSFSEFERILLNSTNPFKTIFNIDRSITYSKNAEIINLRNTMQEIPTMTIMEDILNSKNISLYNNIYDSSFYMKMQISLDKILGYNKLVCAIEKFRKMSFDEGNKVHQKMLNQLWYNLMHPIHLPARKGCHWLDLGFQGDDPTTDFRGMGLLGLMNLLFFTDFYKNDAQVIISYTQSSLHWYPFAIVGINLTSMAYYLLINGDLKHIFYNSFDYSIPDIYTFHQIYSFLFISFHKYWCSQKPKDIMEFSRIMDEFKDIIKDNLREGKMNLNFITTGSI